MCLPRLDSEPVTLDMHALRTFTSCGQDDCIIGPDLLTLCRMMEMPVDSFIRDWRAQERSRPFLFRIITALLWLRVMLRGLLDPLSAFEGSRQALIHKTSSLSSLARLFAFVNAVLCIAILVNTRYEVVLLLYGTPFVAGILLHHFLRFDTVRTR
ncbi:hypothetical protein BDN72DRAFT_895606 [Pluteus cervinus]|uniref:Uncharacterized protein n=1 Tax=Pluteus cervinus TaxID=181527 RepID=A0ACD3AZR5_9AGAR|nr:hypothetical protein BDN72DRAFT_895606 [Pluteus cervinus]